MTAAGRFSTDDGESIPAERRLPSPSPGPSNSNNNDYGQQRGRNTDKPVTPIPPNLLPSAAPASPPTPAPSPRPHHRGLLRHWSPPSDDEEESRGISLTNAKMRFDSLSNAQKKEYLAIILDLCDMSQLSFVSGYVGPLLRKDPFLAFPTELCLRVCSFFFFEKKKK